MQRYLAGLDCDGEDWGLSGAWGELVRTAIDPIIIFWFWKSTSKGLNQNNLKADRLMVFEK
jgi:hypothetical protein